MSFIDNPAGKVAVVTGGASGIGRALAERLIAEGLHVVIADIEEASLAQTAAEIGATGIRTDVSSAESMQALADAVMARFGRVDMVCLNAGVGSGGAIADMTVSDWNWLLGVNLYGVINGVGAFLPLLEANPEPTRLTVTASLAGFHVTPGLGGYCVTKFAVVAYVEGLAMELAGKGSQVGVTMLCPGPVSTRLGSSHRNRPEALSGGHLQDADLEQTEEGSLLRWLPPAQVVQILLDAIDRGELYAFTHAEFADEVRQRHARIDAAYAAV